MEEEDKRPQSISEVSLSVMPCVTSCLQGTTPTTPACARVPALLLLLVGVVQCNAMQCDPPVTAAQPWMLHLGIACVLLRWKLALHHHPNLTRNHISTSHRASSVQRISATLYDLSSAPDWIALSRTIALVTTRLLMKKKDRSCVSSEVSVPFQPLQLRNADRLALQLS